MTEGGGRAAAPESSGDGPVVLPEGLTRVWWLPVAFIAMALLLLLLAPVIVNDRVTALRRDVADVADEARVEVNDLQAAYLTRLFAHDAGRMRLDGSGDSVEVSNIAKVVRDEEALDSLVRGLGPEPVAQLAALERESRAWRALLGPGYEDGLRTAPDSLVARQALRLLTAAEALDASLLRISTAARDRIRVYANVSLVATWILIPMALGALLMLLVIGRRTVRLARAIERERTELRLATAARVALINGVTHDVKNPLGAAIGYVELLQDGIAGPVSGDQRHMLVRVRRLMDVALNTVSELLETARHSAHQGVATADACAMLAELVEDYAASATARGITLRNDCGSAPVRMTADLTRVRRIVGNLISNGIKYAHEGGTVALSATQAAGRCRITVCDDGDGIAPDVGDRIFSEFYRAPGAEAHADGHGMGLAVSRRLARALGGDVRLVASPLGGAGFELELPATT